jgi:cyclopropane fatty-acyl-phospholipid synthase-like methyltransferase
MTCSREEQAQRERLDELYLRARSAVMLSIERSVCGCDYGGSSWTTRTEADQIAALLELRPGRRLLEVGAGSGWPGLYMAEKSGCEVVLTDLPLSGLRIAAERAGRDPIARSRWTVLADAAILPFPIASFDAVSHSDVLCCLRQKRAVLDACRGVIRSDGRMVFTVISIAPHLSPGNYKRAVASGPEFVESDADYPTLLGQTGWAVVDCKDITLDYAASCRRQLQADEEHKDALETLVGASEFAERQADWRAKLSAIDGGLLRRSLFVATPDRA